MITRSFSGRSEWRERKNMARRTFLAREHLVRLSHFLSRNFPLLLPSLFFPSRLFLAEEENFVIENNAQSKIILSFAELRIATLACCTPRSCPLRQTCNCFNWIKPQSRPYYSPRARHRTELKMSLARGMCVICTIGSWKKSRAEIRSTTTAKNFYIFPFPASRFSFPLVIARPLSPQGEEEKKFCEEENLWFRHFSFRALHLSLSRANR